MKDKPQSIKELATELRQACLIKDSDTASLKSLKKAGIKLATEAANINMHETPLVKLEKIKDLLIYATQGIQLANVKTSKEFVQNTEKFTGVANELKQDKETWKKNLATAIGIFQTALKAAGVVLCVAGIIASLVSLKGAPLAIPLLYGAVKLLKPAENVIDAAAISTRVVEFFFTGNNNGIQNATDKFEKALENVVPEEPKVEQGTDQVNGLLPTPN